MSHRQFDPTHVLVITTSGDASAEARATAAAVRAVFDHTDTVVLRLDVDGLASDHPEIANGVRAATEAEGGVLRAAVDQIRDPLTALLDLTDVHRFVTLERLDAFRDGRQVLHYVPDHTTVELDDAASDGVADAVSRAVTDEPVGLLPAGRLADWYEDGTHYELAPPSLCVDDSACFDLAALERVEVDREHHVVRLSWARGDGVLAAASELLGPNRPEQFAFDSPNRYADVAEAFETVADALDVETTRKRS
ncbi:hypothetical protein [Haloarchaeobius baliensis]|uniref:hypothetical protein n=1 Tax=Haloarchaeobius baliensis TaxID=1670458 RepID=UPI003F885B66